ncbi:MAG: hypothetical protein PHX10_13790 [Gallionellaceae bacterium]|nr:hypothetical protein [Gallionellaceae bacterium]
MSSIPFIARPAWFACLLTAGLLATGTVAAAPPYQLGQGYPLPWFGLTAGGYASIHVSALDGEPTTLNVKELSLFLHGDPLPTWHFFTELEVGDVLTASKDRTAVFDGDFDVERLYLDHNLSAHDAVRMGKFLTPIGRWNQIHADPLVWSVTRPLTTSAGFARHASGLELYGSHSLGSGEVDYQVYADATTALDPTEALEQTFADADLPVNPASSFKHGMGLYLRYRNVDDSLQLGLSAARFSLKEQPPAKQLVGLDLFYTRWGWELSGEAIYRRDESGAGRSDRGGYVQLVAPVADRLYAIVSHERYRSALLPDTQEWTGIGLTYRPSPPLSFKLEYRDGRGDARLVPDGVLFSLAVLL